MTQPTILVAGATGTNGSELLKQLAQAGVKARALVRSAERAKHLANEHVELIEGDLADRDSLYTAMKGIEKAYVVTAIHKDTVQWFLNFFDAAKRAGVKHVVKFSGLGADANSPSEIIRQHAASDQALKDSGLTYTILRPNSFFQNMFWQAEAIKHTGQFYLPMADGKQSLVDVRDLAEATVKVLTEAGHENKVYDLTGSESLGYHEVASLLSEATGKTVSYVNIPAEAALQSMRENGMPDWDAKVLVEIQTVFASGAYAEPTNDLAALLGREPTRFSQFANDFKAVFCG